MWLTRSTNSLRGAPVYWVQAEFDLVEPLVLAWGRRRGWAPVHYEGVLQTSCSALLAAGGNDVHSGKGVGRRGERVAVDGVRFKCIAVYIYRGVWVVVGKGLATL